MSKQGEVAMHLPQRWGIVEFQSNTKSQSHIMRSVQLVVHRWHCALYYAMKAYHEKEGKYTNDVEALGAYSKGPFAICKDATMSITLTDGGYEAKAALESFTASVNQDDTW